MEEASAPLAVETSGAVAPPNETDSPVVVHIDDTVAETPAEGSSSGEDVAATEDVAAADDVAPAADNEQQPDAGGSASETVTVSAPPGAFPAPDPPPSSSPPPPPNDAPPLSTPLVQAPPGAFPAQPPPSQAWTKRISLQVGALLPAGTQSSSDPSAPLPNQRMSYRALISSTDRVVSKIRESASSLKFRCMVTIFVASFAELLASIRCAGEPPGAPGEGEYLDPNEQQQLIATTMRYAGCPSPVAGARSAARVASA